MYIHVHKSIIVLSQYPLRCHHFYQSSITSNDSYKQLPGSSCSLTRCSLASYPGQEKGLVHIGLGTQNIIINFIHQFVTTSWTMWAAAIEKPACAHARCTRPFLLLKGPRYEVRCSLAALHDWIILYHPFSVSCHGLDSHIRQSGNSHIRQLSCLITLWEYKYRKSWSNNNYRTSVYVRTTHLCTSPLRTSYELIWWRQPNLNYWVYTSWVNSNYSC